MSQYIFLILLFAFELASAKQRNKAYENPKEITDDKFLSGIQILYPKNEHLCGGVLISTQHVLTAAYCVEGFEEGWDLKLLTLSSGNGSQVRHALTFSIHSGYNRETQENNLAVIKVSPQFKINSGVRPIEITNKNTTGTCFVVTWSIKEKFLTSASNQTSKQVFEEPISACSMNVTNTFCMGSNKNVTICKEDYGCPLVCNGLLTGIFIGPGHACDGFPGVYVKIKAYEKWLSSTAENYKADNLITRENNGRSVFSTIGFLPSIMFIQMVCL